jgi:cytochrome c
MITRAVLTVALIAINVGLAYGADIAAGRTSARALCVNCHVVEPNAANQKTVAADIPSFKAIAEKHGQTEGALKLFMLEPHPPMPRVQLTTHELDNLASYIMSLKEQR